ncbi:late competence development ComFB family protein [Gemmatimonadota bacterium]
MNQRGVKNLQEEAVKQRYEELKLTMPEFCGCEMCSDDVLVYALNRLQPRYVAQPTGEVITHVSLGSDQPKADISVVILDGMRRVSSEPRTGHSSQ